MNECITDSKILISGTGWQTDIEFNSRVIAKNKNIPSVAVIDHWTNYEGRFIFRGKKLYPDHILVSDKYAKKIAEKTFSNISVTELSNIWLKDVVDYYQNNISSKNNFLRPKKLLYLTEPYRQKWSNSKLIPEYQALKYFSEAIDKLSENKLIAKKNQIESIHIKTHPTENDSKYSKYLESLHLPGEIFINKYDSLEDSLLNADVAFGCETQALIVAHACGLNVISTLPPWAPKCKLPHKFIIHISKLS